MINYRNGKERFKPNKLGSLYVDQSKVNDGERPIIYIGGQMEHRCHVLEQTGFTGDPGHNMFTGSWFYDYPVFSQYKGEINGQNMANNLSESLRMAGLGDVDIITESFGGIIGAYATLDPRVHKVYAIHPPITGTPLADPITMSKYKEMFTKREKLILLAMRKLINTAYGFEKENNKGAILCNIDFNKLLVIGSTLDMETEKNGLAKALYEMILKFSGHKSDGVVIYDEDQLDRLGINHLREFPEPRGLNHFDAGSEEHLEYVSKLIYNNDGEDPKTFSLQQKDKKLK